MADILHDLPVKAPIDRVFDAVSTPQGLDTWWSKRAAGTPGEGAVYELSFGPGYDWRARVIKYAPPREFELQLVQADSDWLNSRVSFRLEPRDDVIWLRFSHSGSPGAMDSRNKTQR
ncbi:MAG TPA: SRPBCC domain-containing protein [Woeseiaceae bacterium]